MEFDPAPRANLDSSAVAVGFEDVKRGALLCARLAATTDGCAREARFGTSAGGGIRRERFSVRAGGVGLPSLLRFDCLTAAALRELATACRVLPRSISR